MSFNFLIVLLLLTPFTLGGFTRAYDNCAIVASGNTNIRLHWSYYSGGIQFGIESSNTNGVTAVGVSQKGLKGFGQGSGTFSDFWTVQSPNKNDRQCPTGCVGDYFSSTDAGSAISFDKIQNTMESIVSLDNIMIYGEFTRSLKTNDTYDFNEDFEGLLWVSWGINREVVAFGQAFNVTINGASMVTFSRTKPSTCDSSNTTPGTGKTTSTGSDASTGRTSDASTGKTTDVVTGKTSDVATSTGRTSETTNSTGRTSDVSTGKTSDASTGKTSEASSTGKPSETSTGRTSEIATGKTSEASSTGRTSESSTGKTSAESTGRTSEDSTSKTAGESTGRTSTGDAPSGRSTTGSDDQKEVYLVSMEVTTTIEITKEIFSTAVSVASSVSSDRLVIVSFEQVNKVKRASYDYNTSFYFEDAPSGPSSKDLAYKFTALNGTSLGSNITVNNVNVEQTYVSSETANNAIIYAVSAVVTAFAMLFC